MTLYNLMDIYISIKKAAELIGVVPKTLRNWEKSNKLIPIRTIGGHRRYSVKQLEKLINGENSGNISN